LTHICGKKADGTGFQLWRKTKRNRLKAKVREVKEALRRHLHAPLDEQGRWLNSGLRGHYAYFAVPTNSAALSAFRHHIIVHWIRRLRRRSQRDRMTGARMKKHIDRDLPRPRIPHPWPEQRFRVKYSR
jgi:RNA-directed DNA polymerase